MVKKTKAAPIKETGLNLKLGYGTGGTCRAGANIAHQPAVLSAFWMVGSCNYCNATCCELFRQDISFAGPFIIWNLNLVRHHQWADGLLKEKLCRRVIRIRMPSCRAAWLHGCIRSHTRSGVRGENESPPLIEATERANCASETSKHDATDDRCRYKNALVYSMRGKTPRTTHACLGQSNTCDDE